MEKWEKTTISGHSRRLVPVQVNLYRYRSTCTGTGQHVLVQFGFWSFFVNLYLYRCGTCAVQASRTEPVPVQVRPVPVHPALF